MISSLKITNFALISKLDLQLSDGFTVITGETGSGKSILLGALELLLGERADFSLIGKDGEKAVVEAVTLVGPYDLENFFKANDLEYDTETIIRREISANGRSRAFINDSPVQLTVLRDLTSRLVNIHSQYNTLELRDKNFQLDILDTLGDLQAERAEFQILYSEFKAREASLKQKEVELEEFKKQSDYILFQLEEMDELMLSKVDYDSIEADLRKAENAEQIIRVLGMIEQGISGDEGALDLFARAKNELEKLKSIDQDLTIFSERTTALWLELRDLSSDVSSYADKLEINPALKEKMLAQVDNFNRILRKHNLKNQAELVELQSTYLGNSRQTDELEAEILQLRNSYLQLEEELQNKANVLHAKRANATEAIEASITQLLTELKLENTSLTFDVSKKAEIGVNGITELVLRFSANKGIDPVAIEKAASGGELSRVMLALQKLISDKKALPTVLFDEIDTGVSGDVAQKMGNLLRKMGEQRQLIAITHLPQVAAKAQHHYRVQKKEMAERTITTVNRLLDDEKVEEIARLMSGEQISNAALQTAKALIND